MNGQPIELHHAAAGEDGLERDARLFRNGSLIGAVALEGVALLDPGLSAALTASAVISLFAAGGFEQLHRAGRQRRAKNARL